MKRALLIASCIVALWPNSNLFASPALNEQPSGRPELTVCDIISREAQRQKLPVWFFARLIWKESRFDPNAVSPNGAQGIAQFMPATAKSRGLANPFRPADAIQKSAHYLAELHGSFGNIGLAAAAYNAGKGRVQNWLAGKSILPQETLDYVFFITGRRADEWAEPAVRHIVPPVGRNMVTDCVILAARGAEKQLTAANTRRQQTVKMPRASK